MLPAHVARAELVLKPPLLEAGVSADDAGLVARLICQRAASPSLARFSFLVGRTAAAIDPRSASHSPAVVELIKAWLRTREGPGPAELVDMDAEALNPARARDDRERIRRCLGAKVNTQYNKDIKCVACEKFMVLMSWAQTRSGDEGYTFFYTCFNCMKSWSDGG